MTCYSPSQIFITDTDTLGPASVVRMSRVIVFCIEEQM